MSASNVAAGHKANLANPSAFPPRQSQTKHASMDSPSLTLRPDTSEESKEHSKEVLGQTGTHEKDPSHVAAGLKACVSPSRSPAAPQGSVI